VVAAVEGHAGSWKVRGRDGFGKHRAAIAVLAGEDGGIAFHVEFPELEFFIPDRGPEALGQRDLVEQPIGACGVGDIFDAVGKEDSGNQRAPIPVFRAGELLGLQV
jgi:hypothetical protein